MSTRELLANSIEKQSLVAHLRAVGRVAKALATAVGADENTQCLAYYAGLLHDIGKATPTFQAMLSKSKEATAEAAEQVSFSGPYHNEVGFAILTKSSGGEELLDMLLPGSKILKKGFREIVATSVLWHHACRGGDSETIVVSSADAASILDLVATLCPDVDTSTLNFEVDDPFSFKSLYSGPGSAKNRACEKVVRSCLIAADHAVSCLSAADCRALANGAPLTDFTGVAALLDTGLHIDFTPDPPRTERDKNQMLCATASGALTQVNAPTGFGKTRIGVARTACRQRKSMWVCPRNTVAESVYANVCDEIKELGLDVSVELYLTSARQAATPNAPDTEFTSDIVVTNIDMLLKPQVDYRLPERLYSALSYDIVFDEFHEFAMKDSPLFAAFTDLLRARLVCTSTSTMCLSATPMNILEAGGLDPSAVTVLPARGKHFPAVHTLPYKLNLVRTGNTATLPRAEDETDVAQTMVMFNSIKNAQRHTSKSSRRILVHSKYTKADRAQRMSRLMAAFGRDGDATDEYVVTAPVLQAALNISFREVHISSGGAEMDLQAARTNRFGERERGSITYYDMHSNHGERAAVNARWDSKLQVLWFDYLLETFGASSTITLDELYAAYNKFYEVHGDEILKLLNAWRDKGASRVCELAPRRFVLGAKSGVSKAQGATLRNPDGSCSYVVRTTVGDKWLSNDAFSCDEREIEKFAESETWLSDTREREKLARELGPAYKCLLKLPQGKRRLEFARNIDTPFPATSLVYDSEDGVIFGADADFVVG